MKLRTGPDGTMVQDGERWVSLAKVLGEEDPAARDALACIAAHRNDEIAAAVAAAGDDATVDPAQAGLPFAPSSMRAFMLWESHVVASSRMLVKHFFPPPMWKAVSTFERVTGKTFPKLRPNARWHREPTFYMANHTMTLADGEPMWWPSHTKVLDFELELACVLKHEIADATPQQAREAIGGWTVLNDWSARDVQADDARHNIFGPVVKAKTFANSLGCDVLTADEVPDWTQLGGRVRVDGEEWCSGTAADPKFDMGELLAYASQGERLRPGDVFSSGTLPGCCGLEHERWVQPGQTVELEIDGIGTLTNRIDPEARP